MVERGIFHLWEESGDKHKFDWLVNVLQETPNWELKVGKKLVLGIPLKGKLLNELPPHSQ